MASIRITGAERLPDHVFHVTVRALIVGQGAPSKHAQDKLHACGRVEIEKALPPDSQFRTAVENIESLTVLDRSLLLRAEAAAWSQLRKLRAGDQKARAN